MRILYVLEFLPPYVRREILSLAKRGHEITVLMPAASHNETADLWSRITENPDSTSVSTLHSVPFDLLTAGTVSLAAPSLRGLRFPAQSAASLAAGEFRYFLAASEAALALPSGYHPDLIHTHFALDAAQVARKLGRMLRVPYTITTHATDIFVVRRRDRLIRVLEDAAAVLTISDFNRRHLSSAGLFKGPVTLCRLGVPVEELPRREDPANPLGGVCVASGLVRKKGVDILLEALGMVKDSFPSLEITVVGADPGGTVLERLRRRARSLPVRFTGVLDSRETLQLVSRAGFFVLPCTRAPNGDMDGIPVALMEAMGMGVPCISTRISGVPELIRHGESGLLAEPGSPESLAEALASLAETPDAARTMAKKGRERILEQHSPDRQAEIMTELFKRTVNG